MKPCPTDLPQTLNPDAAGVEAHRNFDCRHYDACLNEAVRCGWQSFTCSKCPLSGLQVAPELEIDAYANQRRAI